MQITNKRILVPTDFTKVGDTALEHAIVVAKAIGAEINCLHVIASKKGISEARMKLDTLKERIQAESNLTITTMVRIGSIFEDIDKVASETEASLIIMGTHGLRGMQFLTGSRALKIVTESSIPFIICQERGIRPSGYQKLVVPLDLHKETKQKLSLVGDVARYFGSQVHLVSPGETDEFLKNQLQRNIIFAEDYLTQRGVTYSVEITDSKSDGFVKSLLKYAASVDADLICIMNFYDSSFMSIFNQSYEQQIITNDAQIPVLCVNPVETFVMDRAAFAP
ncbi:MAG: universal stress protein [Flavobacteriales bacterium]|nr:universal stress protein [Flavobacteriales bacterium]